MLCYNFPTKHCLSCIPSFDGEGRERVMRRGEVKASFLGSLENTLAGPVVDTCCFHHWTWVQSMVRELRSHTPKSVAEKKKKKKKKERRKCTGNNGYQLLLQDCISYMQMANSGF